MAPARGCSQFGHDGQHPRCLDLPMLACGARRISNLNCEVDRRTGCCNIGQRPNQGTCAKPFTTEIRCRPIVPFAPGPLRSRRALVARALCPLCFISGHSATPACDSNFPFSGYTRPAHFPGSGMRPRCADWQYKSEHRHQHERKKKLPENFCPPIHKRPGPTGPGLLMLAG